MKKKKNNNTLDIIKKIYIALTIVLLPIGPILKIISFIIMNNSDGAIKIIFGALYIASIFLLKFFILILTILWTSYAIIYLIIRETNKRKKT